LREKLKNRSMFTGIIEEIGTVQAVKRGTRSSQLTVHALKVTADLRTGDSINTNGVCLTVTSFDKTSFTADVMPETMSRSNLGQLVAGSPVNLERAVQLSGRLGGHLVSGHIDGTGRIARRTRDENAEWFHITATQEILKYIAEKGSVAIDGISLTVARVDHDGFSVSIIPHTLMETTITNRKIGEQVNIECDMIAKYLERLIKQGRGEGKIDPRFLADNGFID
jgi:riboflavin synthase